MKAASRFGLPFLLAVHTVFVPVKLVGVRLAATQARCDEMPVRDELLSCTRPSRDDDPRPLKRSSSALPPASRCSHGPRIEGGPAQLK